MDTQLKVLLIMFNLFKYKLKIFQPALMMLPLLFGIQSAPQVRKFTKTEIISAENSPESSDKKLLPEIFNSAAAAVRNESGSVQKNTEDYFSLNTNYAQKNSSLHLFENKDNFCTFLREISIITVSGRAGPPQLIFALTINEKSTEERS